MPRGNIKNLKNFPKGVSGNPAGRKPLTEAQRALRTLTIEKYKEVIELALTGTFDELKKFADNKDGTGSAIEVGIARILVRAINEGDASVFETFAARIVGKIPDQLVVNSTNTNTSSTNVNIQAVIAPAIARLALKEINEDV